MSAFRVLRYDHWFRVVPGCGISPGSEEDFRCQKFSACEISKKSDLFEFHGLSFVNLEVQSGVIGKTLSVEKGSLRRAVTREVEEETVETHRIASSRIPRPSGFRSVFFGKWNAYGTIFRSEELRRFLRAAK